MPVLLVATARAAAARKKGMVANLDSTSAGHLQDGELRISRTAWSVSERITGLRREAMLYVLERKGILNGGKGRADAPTGARITASQFFLLDPQPSQK